MSSSSFNVIRKHSAAAASIRLKELTQELARQRSQNAGSQLETDDIRSQGRMDHSTIKLNDDRLKFITTLNAASTDFFYEFPTEPDFTYLKVWFMLDHLGARMRDMSGLGNDAYISGHPTLRRAGLDLGFQQTSAGGGTSATPVMLFNSGTDVVSQTNGEYIWIPDNTSIQFTQFSAGFSIAFRFNCLNFNSHLPLIGGSYSRRFAAKTDNASNGWNLMVYPTSTEGTTGGVEFEIRDSGTDYARKTVGYSSNTWYQVVVTYNRTAAASERIKIYTAGTENSLSSTFGTILPTHTNLRIGARDAETGFFYGYIHDFRLYMDKVLTQSEITNLNQNEMTIDNIIKGRIFIVQYAMVSASRRSTIHKFNIGGDVQRNRIHKFHIATKITRTRTHKFNVLDEIERTRTHKFNIIKTITRTRTHKYNMGGEVTATRTHKYNINVVVTTTRTHKYYIGDLQSQYLRFQKSTTAGSNIIQDITFNGKPQAILVWTDGSTSDNTFTDGLGVYYGFSDGTHHACVSAVSRDNIGVSDTFSGIKDDKVIALSDSTTAVGTVVAEATVSFMDTNTARFTWTTNNTAATYIHCLALWGFNNAEVKTFEAGQTTTGNRIYSLEKSFMTPTIINTINNSAPLGWSTSFGVSPSIGMATSSSKQYSVGIVIEDAQSSSDAASYYDATKVLVALNDDSTTSIDAAGSLVSFQSGSFTIDWTDAPAGTTKVFSVLVLDAHGVDVGMFAQPITTPQSQVINTAPNVDSVKSVVVINNSQFSTGFQTVGAMCIGAGSGTGATDQGLVVVRENDNSGTMVSVSQNKTGSIAKTITAAATAASSTTTTEGSLSALGTDQFTINWTAVDASARNFFYMVFGGSGFSTVSRTRTHKYHIEGEVTATRTHKYHIEGEVTATRTHKFDITVEIASTTRTHKYNITVSVTRTRTHKYDVTGKITGTRTHKYNVTGVEQSYTEVYNVAQNTTYTIYSGGYRVVGEKFNNASHGILGTIPKRVIVWLRKVGTPTGTVSVVLRDGSNDNLIDTFGTIDASSLTTTLTQYTFTNNSQSHSMSLNDRINVEYSGGDGSNHVLVGVNVSGTIDPYAVLSVKTTGSYTDQNDELGAEIYY